METLRLTNLVLFNHPAWLKREESQPAYAMARETRSGHGFPMRNPRKLPPHIAKRCPAMIARFAFAFLENNRLLVAEGCVWLPEIKSLGQPDPYGRADCLFWFCSSFSFFSRLFLSSVLFSPFFLFSLFSTFSGGGGGTEEELFTKYLRSLRTVVEFFV